MTDDIVTRLQGSNDCTCLFHTEHGLIRKCLFCEAADEIERLQELVTTWIICAERLVESNEGEAYKKALAFYLDCQRIAKETC